MILVAVHPFSGTGTGTGPSRLKIVDGKIVINEVRTQPQRKPRRAIDSYAVTQEEEVEVRAMSAPDDNWEIRSIKV